MKNYMLTATLCCAIFFTSCKGQDKNNTQKIAQEALDSDQQSELSGTFKADGKSYTGKVSTQVFPETKEFSVLCQADDEKGTLMQITFKDEASAHSEQNLKIVEDHIMHPNESNEADFAFDIKYQSKDDMPGTAKVVKENGHYTIVFENIEVSDATKKEKTTVSGKIPFE